MTDRFDRIARLAALAERVGTLADFVKALSLEDHRTRLVRIEAMIEIARPDGVVLRITRDPGGDTNAG